MIILSRHQVTTIREGGYVKTISSLGLKKALKIDSPLEKSDNRHSFGVMVS
jgi:hypothetical protein